MAEKLSERPLPGPWLRWFLRAPIVLYRARLGFLMRGRFLLLHHVGRKSGLPRENVLEVVAHDPETDRYYVAVGFGPRSDWYRNLKRTPEARIEVGSRRLAVRARDVELQEGGDVMVDYARRYPGAAKNLMKFCGFRVDGSEADYRDVVRKGLRFVALEPR